MPVADNLRVCVRFFGKHIKDIEKTTTRHDKEGT